MKIRKLFCLKLFFLLGLLLLGVSKKNFSQNDFFSLEKLALQKLYHYSDNNPPNNNIDISKKNNNIYRLAITFTSENFIDSFPSIAERFPNLQEIRIEGDYSHVPSEIFKFKKLQVLILNLCNSDNCEHTNMITLSDELFELNDLKVLEIRGISSLLYIPEQISKLSKLSYLKFEAFLGPVMLPISLAYLPKLKNLEVSPPCNSSVIIDDQRHRAVFSDHLCDFSEEMNFIKSHYLMLDSNRLYYYPDSDKNNLIPYKEREIASFYKNGNKCIVGQLDSLKKPTGSWKFYYKNGKLKEERFYVSGMETGNWTVYDSLGVKLVNYYFSDSITHFVWYYENGKIRKESFFKNSMAYGVWKSYTIDAEISSEYSYQNDCLNGPVKLYSSSNGNKITIYEVNYKNGKKHGSEIYRNASNQLEKNNFYINGKLQEK